MYCDSLRPAINIVIDCAPPQRALPRAKNKRLARRTDRRPKILDTFPAIGMAATVASPYAEPIHTNCVPCNAATIVGKAVATDNCR